ncbi:hypothetical protein [Burkholderia gladioli]|uniref:hypothetical protein n=1 Tax=Burkholderia gladioli TaxID=28095 RepID=UPI00163F9A2C|nr:hypothetical protein [Burkholderia gladioli]
MQLAIPIWDEEARRQRIDAGRPLGARRSLNKISSDDTVVSEMARGRGPIIDAS